MTKEEPTKKRKSRKKAKRKRRLISALRLRRLAYACEDMAEADHAAALRRPLADLIAGDATLAAAWRRGQLLRNLEGCAAAIMTVTQAAKLLGFESGQRLRELLDTDAEVRNIWEQSRIQAIYLAKKALAAAAKGGNQAAIRAIDVFLHDEGGVSIRPNFARVTMTQLTELFGVSRQAIYQWYSDKGLGRNADGTFDLRETIAWFERHVEARAAGGSGPADIDPMRTLKTRQIELNLDRELGRLLDRDAVISGQVARFKVLARSLAAISRDVAPMLENQSLLRIREILEAEVRNILVEQNRIPEELELPKEAAASLAECYEQLV